MNLSADTFQKLVELVALLERDNPNLDLRIRCAALQIRGGQVMFRMKNLGMAELERWFWSMVKRNDETGCWEWTGCRDEHGYGKFKAKGRRYLAHRASLIYATGNDSHLWACHRCNNPPCVSPFHLYWGTPKNNYDDSVENGSRSPVLSGELNANSKIKWADVNYIRNSNESLTQLGEKFGLSKHYVWKVRRNYRGAWTT
jgi:hypothetical protein